MADKIRFVIVEGDGMAGEPASELGGRTPLESARTPNLDCMASRGILGLTRTIPRGFPPGSDIGTMSVLGYDPRRYHTGRSPIEAAAMGVELGPSDVAFRMNLVTCEVGEDGLEVLADFTAGHVAGEEAAELVAALGAELGGDGIEIYRGVSYRHLLVWRGGQAGMRTTPPHDITGRPTGPELPVGPGADVLRELMERGRRILADHPVNRARIARGEKPANAIWLWGQGRRMEMPTLRDRFGVEGSVISAVDLVNGLGILAGLKRIEVPGATGFTDTNYRGKADYGLRALAEREFLLLHVEAPDECGHMGDAGAKVRAIEDLDEKVVAPLLEGLRAAGGEWRVLVTADHATPCTLRTHSADPVPFCLYTSEHDGRGGGTARAYSEKDARDRGIFIAEAHTIIERLVRP